MARPAVIKDEAIIAAARAVFLEQGFAATTAEVASRAGVSEGSIFKRFRSKVELFQAAMQPDVEEPAFLKRLTASSDERIEETLCALGREVANFFRTITPLILMSWSHPAGSLCLSGDNPAPIRTVRALTDFVRRAQTAGRLGKVDADVFARAFLGAIHNFVFFEIVFKATGPHASQDSFVRGLVELLLHGAKAPRGSRKASQ